MMRMMSSVRGGGIVQSDLSDEGSPHAIPSDAGGSTNTKLVAKRISTANLFACGILRGSVQCWGDIDFSGGFGTVYSSVPLAVSGITSAVAVTTGEVHVCAILSRGTVQCWGENGYGQLGNGTTTNTNVPVTVSGITSAVDIAAGAGFACAMLDSTVQCWGSNHDGELGNGTTTNSSVPVAVSGF
jgi:alpha-tubulin suppressor-like RCC1 family protein